MLLAALISLLMKDGVSSEITLCAFIVLGMGASMVLIFRNHHTNIQKREGYLIVTIGWLLMAVTGMLPFLTTGSIDSVYDAFFETELHSFLKKNKIETLYFCGLLTGVCVLNSLFSGFNSGYRIHLIENCCSDRTKKRHDSVFKNYTNYLFIKENI